MHTHMNMYTHTITHTDDLHNINFKKPGTDLWPARTWFKIEVLFIGNRLLQINLTIMEAFITKEMDRTKIMPNFILEHIFMLWASHRLKPAHLHFYL